MGLQVALISRLTPDISFSSRLSKEVKRFEKEEVFDFQSFWQVT